MTNTLFNADDLGFIAQVARAECDANIFVPKADALMEVYVEFQELALNPELATWDRVVDWLDRTQDCDVWDDILELLMDAARRDVA